MERGALAWFDRPGDGPCRGPGLAVEGWVALPGPPAGRPVLRLDGREVPGLLLGRRADVQAAHPALPWVRGFSAYASREPGAPADPAFELSVEVDGRTLATRPGRLDPPAAPPRPVDLFLVGAPRAGTTALADWLARDPRICMSRPKEPFFFEWDAEYRRGPAVYWGRYFDHYAGQAVVGEARARNLYLPYVPERIHLHNPGARILVTLRHPIERAVSDWWYAIRAGAPGLPFHNAVGLEMARLRRGDAPTSERIGEVLAGLTDTGASFAFPTLVETGRYAEQLARYLAHFPRDRVQVLVHEEWTREPARALAGIPAFLGLGAAGALAVPPPRVNANPTLPGWRARLLDALEATLGRLGLAFFPEERHRHWLARDTLAFLQDYYRGPVAQLEDMLGRKLPWRL